MIYHVLRDDVLRIWNVVEPMLATVTALTHGAYIPSDVLREIMAGDQILWVAYDRERETIDAIFTTAVVNYPGRRSCRVIYCAGAGLERWGLPFVETVERYAREMGATLIEGSNRRGWARKYPGMKEDGVRLFKELAQ